MSPHYVRELLERITALEAENTRLKTAITDALVDLVPPVDHKAAQTKLRAALKGGEEGGEADIRSYLSDRVYDGIRSK